MKKPKSIWIILDPLDGPHVYRSRAAAFRDWERWRKEAVKDIFDSYWEMTEPTEYVPVKGARK